MCELGHTAGSVLSNAEPRSPLWLASGGVIARLLFRLGPNHR